jgi:hypothetical protein
MMELFKWESYTIFCWENMKSAFVAYTEISTLLRKRKEIKGEKS